MAACIQHQLCATQDSMSMHAGQPPAASSLMTGREPAFEAFTVAAHSSNFCLMTLRSAEMTAAGSVAFAGTAM